MADNTLAWQKDEHYWVLAPRQLADELPNPYNGFPGQVALVRWSDTGKCYICAATGMSDPNPEELMRRVTARVLEQQIYGAS